MLRKPTFRGPPLSFTSLTTRTETVLENFVLFTIQQSDAAASPRIYYWLR